MNRAANRGPSGRGTLHQTTIEGHHRTLPSQLPGTHMHHTGGTCNQRGSWKRAHQAQEGRRHRHGNKRQLSAAASFPPPLGQLQHRGWAPVGRTWLVHARSQGFEQSQRLVEGKPRIADPASPWIADPSLTGQISEAAAMAEPPGTGKAHPTWTEGRTTAGACTIIIKSGLLWPWF